MGKKRFTIIVESAKHKIPKTTYEIEAFSAERAIECIDKKIKAKYKMPISEVNYIIDQISNYGDSTRISENSI